MLGDKLSEYVRACFTGLWVQSHEHGDALAEIAALCRDESWSLAMWDVDAGLTVGGQAQSGQGGSDPLAAVRAASALATPGGTSLLVLVNFHRFLGSAEVVQSLARQVVAGKQTRTIVVILAPVVNLPVELEKLFVTMGHDLPGREQLQAIARGIATEDGELPDGRELDAVLDAAAGLTRLEAENAFSLSLVRHGKVTSDAIWELKTQALKNTGTLTLYRGGEDFSSLGGLSALKAFCKRALLGSGSDRKARPRGVLLLSPPGCGKSQFCKSLGAEVGRPVVTLDVGSLMGSLVGQSEERTRLALKTIDALAPCVVMVDEVEKAFAGVGGQGDSGVATRMFGTFLSWLNDRTSDAFVVCTANDVSRLPPEFARAERFDGVFFLDLPTTEERAAIWGLYVDQFGLDPGQRRPVDADWTGAEIKSCCRLASLLDLPLVQAAANVVPVAVTAAESVRRLRTWASGRCLSATEPGLYRHAAATGPSRRRVSRDPSSN